MNSMSPDEIHEAMLKGEQAMLDNLYLSASERIVVEEMSRRLMESLTRDPYLKLVGVIAPTRDKYRLLSAAIASVLSGVTAAKEFLENHESRSQS